MAEHVEHRYGRVWHDEIRRFDKLSGAAASASYTIAEFTLFVEYEQGFLQVPVQYVVLFIPAW